MEEDQSVFWTVTVLSFGVQFIPTIVKMVLAIFYQETESESHLRRQISDLKSEIVGISMVDEFAKYAKIQRKVNKVTEELSNQSQVRSTYRLKVKYTFSAILYIISGLVILYLYWQRGNTPILQIPSHWVYPFDSIILSRWEDKVGLSLTMWMLLSSTVAKVVSRSTL